MVCIRVLNLLKYTLFIELILILYRLGNISFILNHSRLLSIAFLMHLYYVTQLR